MSVMPEGAGLGGVLPRGAQSPVMRVAQAASALEAGSGSTAGGDAALEKACSEFESLFIYKMLSTMRATIPSSELLGGGGAAKDTYTSMMDLHLSRELAGKGGIGLAAMLMERFKSAQEPEAGSQRNVECNV